MVTFANDGSKQTDHRCQNGVTRFVTESIIELFETINIEHEDCEFMSEFASIFDG